MEIDISNVTASYRERVQRLALFDPLFRLENKKTTDNSNQPIDYFSLGLLTLLFFFENKLVRNSKTGVKELADFFQKINQGKMDLEGAGFQKLAREIIEVFRPPSGKRNFRTFYNWTTRQEETVFYAILKTDKFDTRTNAQYYSLDEDGLELIFATREYFSEFQISINQLLLRKQLERGQFWGALRQIEEMQVAVETLKERMVRIRHEIQRNIVSDSTYQRYRETIEDIHLRLSREDREFEELQAFVRETRERLTYEQRTVKEQQAYQLIGQIDVELGEAHHQHGQLLQESIELKTTALEAAQESLYYAGIDSFNFQKEITERLMSTPLPLEAARLLVEPFLLLERREEWSPLTVFARQRVENSRENDKNEGFLEAVEEGERAREQEALRQNYRQIMELILEVIGERDSISLKEVIDYCHKTDKEYLLQHRLFYDFWILLHQRSPLICREHGEDNRDNLLGGVRELLQDKAASLTVVEKEQVIAASKRYSIKDMELRLEGQGDVI
ncbi:MAG: replicative DNA helicase [Syntrophomonas sp.]